MDSLKSLDGKYRQNNGQKVYIKRQIQFIDGTDRQRQVIEGLTDRLTDIWTVYQPRVQSYIHRPKQRHRPQKR